MKINKQPKLSFHGVDIFNVDYTCEQPFKFDQGIALEVDSSLMTPSENDTENDFHVLMILKLQVEGFFSLSVRGVGHFEIHLDLEDTQRESFINSNAPAIMFPYLRSFVSTFSANCGQALSCLVIPPHSFSGKLKLMEEPKPKARKKTQSQEHH